MSGASTLVPFKDGVGQTRGFVAYDTSGTGAGPFILVRGAADASGAVINPAADESVQALTALLTSRLPALDGGKLPVSIAAPTGLAQDSSLASILAKISADPATQTTLAAMLAKLPTAPALDASVQSAVTALGSILTAVQAQRDATVWTDDTSAFFIRIDNRGTISWTDQQGNASSPPGTGARPAAGNSAIVDVSRYQATAGGAGFTTGDYLSHVVIADPQSGTVIGHFWLNASTETKLNSSPGAGNIAPISALPVGAATSSLQTTGNTSLAAIAAAEVSISSVAAIVPSDAIAVSAGRQFAIICSSAGNVKVGFSGGGTLTIPVAVGLTLLPWQITQVFVTGTTATATFANLN